MQQTIFVTGAASGIGRATAELFLSRGWLVGMVDFDREGLRRVAAALDPAHVWLADLDVTDAVAYERTIADFGARTGGRLDVLFNCAGVLRQSRFEELSRADERTILEVNVLGVSNGIHAALPLLKKTPGAHIVTMSSSAAIYGVPEEAMYSASKFAVRALTEALSLEFEPYGITVSDIMPPIVHTPMVTEQAYAAAVYKNLKDRAMGADAVARVVWQAAHGAKLHWLPTREVQRFARAHRVSTRLARSVMKRMSSHS
jgi:NAD(P)-dependent dehydrogenase (short-subunit alcohol dehydrogenase family)